MGGRGEKGKGGQGRTDGERRKEKDMGKPGKTRMKLSKTAGWWADRPVELKFFTNWHLHLFQYNAKHETKSYPFLPKYSPKHFVGVKGGKGKPKIERVLGGRECREKKEHWYIPRNHFQPLTFHRLSCLSEVSAQLGRVQKYRTRTVYKVGEFAK